MADRLTTNDEVMVTFVGGPKDLSRRLVRVYGDRRLWVMKPTDLNYRAFVTEPDGISAYTMPEHITHVRGSYLVEPYARNHEEYMYVAFWQGWEDGSA